MLSVGKLFNNGTTYMNNFLPIAWLCFGQFKITFLSCEQRVHSNIAWQVDVGT